MITLIVGIVLLVLAGYLAYETTMYVNKQRKIRKAQSDLGALLTDLEVLGIKEKARDVELNLQKRSKALSKKK